MEVFLFFAVCFLASTIGAISGIGGGIMIKPLLEAVSVHGAGTISFLSSCAVLSMATTALLRRRRTLAKIFDKRRGTMLALGSTLGGVGGKLLFDCLRAGFDEARLGLTQSAVLSLLVVFLIGLTIQSRLKPHNLQNGAACAATGLLLGMLSAFIGIGGGPLNIAALTYLLSMDSKTASLHSIYIILFSQIASLLLTVLRGTVPEFIPSLLCGVIAGGVLGGLFGSRIAMKVDNRQTRRLYIGVLVFVLLLSLGNVYSYLPIS